MQPVETSNSESNTVPNSLYALSRLSSVASLANAMAVLTCPTAANPSEKKEKPENCTCPTVDDKQTTYKEGTGTNAGKYWCQ